MSGPTTTIPDCFSADRNSCTSGLRVMRRARRGVAMTRVPPRGEKVTLRRATRSARARRGAQVEALEDRREHDPHLHLRERRAEAAAHAAAVRDPGVGRRRALDEALGAEGVRVRVGVRAGVGEPDRGRDVGARGQRAGRCTRGRPPAAGRRAGRPGAAAATRRPRRARTARRRRACGPSRAGWRVSRSSVQASPVAVVSCPASSSVISWSRTSRSVIAEPSSKRTCTSSEQMSSPGVRAPRGDLRQQPRVDLRRHLRSGARAACGGRTAPRPAAAWRPSPTAGRAGGRAARRARTRRRPRAGSPRA